jgi:hypothetical protein
VNASSRAIYIPHAFIDPAFCRTVFKTFTRCEAWLMLLVNALVSFCTTCESHKVAQVQACLIQFMRDPSNCAALTLQTDGSIPSRMAFQGATTLPGPTPAAAFSTQATPAAPVQPAARPPPTGDYATVDEDIDDQPEPLLAMPPPWHVPGTTARGPAAVLAEGRCEIPPMQLHTATPGCPFHLFYPSGTEPPTDIAAKTQFVRARLAHLLQHVFHPRDGFAYGIPRDNVRYDRRRPLLAMTYGSRRNSALHVLRLCYARTHAMAFYRRDDRGIYINLFYGPRLTALGPALCLRHLFLLLCHELAHSFSFGGHDAQFANAMASAVLDSTPAYLRAADTVVQPVDDGVSAAWHHQKWI